jgi:plastocyanin
MMRYPTFATLILLAMIAAASAQAAVIQVTISNLTFAPNEVSAHVGDTIEWINKDFVAHTATARDKQFDIKIPAGANGRTTVTSVGVTNYFCIYHPSMTGSVRVTERTRR